VDRAALREVLVRQEKNMRAEPGSEPYLEYWKRGGSEQYRAALEQLDASTNALAGLGAPRPASAQPAKATASTPASPSQGA
jgi:hypothetical protein